MKVLTVIVPCYNSQAYMSNCIESLLTGGEEVEILIVDDGSRDDTFKIAAQYQQQYPNIVRTIHQENKGHGGAVNTGIACATGQYLKVVDSDDWVDVDAYQDILHLLSSLITSNNLVDMVVNNFVYEKDGKKHKKVMEYTNIFPQNKVFSWDDIKRNRLNQYLLMHSVVYRTTTVLDSGLKLPEHTFYVDNLYVYVVLPHVKTIYYRNKNLYHYFIGRSDQSVNEKIMIQRIEQQLLVNQLMLEHVDLKRIKNKNLQHYLLSYLKIITSISSILLILQGTKESLNKRDLLWQHIHKHDVWTYHKLRTGIMGKLSNASCYLSKKAAVAFYRAAQLMIGFS